MSNVAEKLEIKEGMTFKNYNELCSFMSWKNIGGDYRKARIKELSTMCKWHNEGYKFVIEEVYKEQLIKVDKRKDKAVYVDLVKVILFYALKNFQGELYFSVNEFTNLLEMFNKEYYEIKAAEEYEDCSFKKEIDLNTLKNFKIGSKREAQRIIDRALRAMQNERIIDFVQGRIIVTKDNNYRLATVEERRKITRIEAEELKKLGCLNMYTLKFRNLENKFYYRLRKRFENEGLEYINYTFFGYSIVSHDKTIAEEIEKIEKEDNVIELKKLFRKRLLQFAESSNKREVEKEYKKIEFGEPILEFNTIASSAYIPNFKKAIETFI